MTLYGFLLKRIRQAHFSWDANLLALIGLPVFSYLLLRSRIAYQKGSVVWKGRHYAANRKPVRRYRMKCGRDALTTAGVDAGATSESR